MQVAPKHDFTAKLRQTTLMPAVLDYVAWQKEVRKAVAAGAKVPEMPTLPLASLNLDLTTACNYACTHCIDWDKLNTGIRYAEPALMESLGTLIEGGLKSVILIGGGEPTIHRHFEEVVRFLKERGVMLGIVTNGSRGDVLERIAPLLSERDWIRLSLDSGKNETFIRMHVPKSRAISLESICAWVPKIRSANPRVQVGFSFIIVWDGAKRAQEIDVLSNIDEIVEAATLAKAHGFSYISYKPFLTRFGDGSEVVDMTVAEDEQETLSRIAAAVAEAKQLESAEFRVLESTNLRVLMAGNWRDYTKQPTTCHMMAFRQVLSPLGLFHCPAKRGVENSRVADNDAFVAQKFPETRTRTGAMLRNFDASRECAQITCLYNQANWWMERLIAGDGDAEATPLSDRQDYYL